MANFKRTRSRSRASGKIYDKWLAKSLEKQGVYYYWLSSSPAWHDLLYHTRPARRRTKHVERAIMSGADLDEISLPHWKKPHKYYW